MLAPSIKTPSSNFIQIHLLTYYQKKNLSPEDVQTNIAFQVNVGMIDHGFTLHFWRIMWVPLANLETEHKATTSVVTLERGEQSIITLVAIYMS